MCYQIVGHPFESCTILLSLSTGCENAMHSSTQFDQLGFFIFTSDVFLSDLKEAPVVDLVALFLT